MFALQTGGNLAIGALFAEPDEPTLGFKETILRPEFTPGMH